MVAATWCTSSSTTRSHLVEWTNSHTRCVLFDRLPLDAAENMPYVVTMYDHSGCGVVLVSDVYTHKNC